MFKPICPDCYTKKVHKNGVNNRILYFYDKKKVNAEIQRYKCEKYGKNFYTNINDIVSEN